MASNVIDNSFSQSIEESWVSLNQFMQETVGYEILAIMEKVQEIAFTVLSYVGTALLFLSNSSIFVLGMLAGAITTEKMASTIGEIKVIYARIMKDKAYTPLAFMITGAVFAWPITMAVTAFFVGSHYGIQLKQPR